MRLDDILRAEINTRLKNWGVPQFVIKRLAEEYGVSSGHELYSIFKDAYVSHYTNMVEWFEDIPTEWDICSGYTEHRQQFDAESLFYEDIYELSSMYPAVVIRRNCIFVYLPE